MREFEFEVRVREWKFCLRQNFLAYLPLLLETPTKTSHSNSKLALTLPLWYWKLAMATLSHPVHRSLLSSVARRAKEDGEGGWQHFSESTNQHASPQI